MPELLALETAQRVRDKFGDWNTQVSTSNVLWRLWPVEAEDDGIRPPPLTMWSVRFESDHDCIDDALALKVLEDLLLFAAGHIARSDYTLTDI